MVCCALISLVIAGLIWPIRFLVRLINPAKASPLMWQLASAEGPENRSPSFSLSARIESFGYAFSGLRFVIQNEHNARIHIAAAFAVFAIGAFYQVSSTDWLILVLAIVSVWFAETINTAFEYLCDVVSPQKNEAVKHAKDIAAGAVLITAVGAVIIGTIVLFPYVKIHLSPAIQHVDFLELAALNLCTASGNE